MLNRTAAPDLDGWAITERLLADLLTGDDGGERVLQDLEAANAFVVSLDAARTWFRYHQMFAGLLRLELRRTTPGEVTALHRAAAGWLAGHGFAVAAIRHAQAARDWDLAAGLVADAWPGLHLDGQSAATHELLAGFPAEARAADAGLAALVAADEPLGSAWKLLAQVRERGIGAGATGSAARPGSGRRRRRYGRGSPEATSWTPPHGGARTAGVR